MTDHVDVVVTHYEDPQRLGWVLDALAQQWDPSGEAFRMHVVVADDGSRVPPPMPAGISFVTQPDEGFRAAAARNLGAARGRSPYVLFLDGDTVPEPGWCCAMVNALKEADDGTGALVVGRRRHADLTGLGGAGEVASWVARPEERSPQHLLREPSWLVDGYARTEGLRSAGPGDWRFVISACIGMTREAFERIGGFDTTIVGYGGEDWDLAYRAWNTGVALRHAPSAVAWHDGPDAVTRADFAALKEGEQLALAQRIPQPDVRGRNALWPQPRVVVRWHAAGTSSAQFVAMESWLALGDVGIWRPGFENDDASPLPDPRVRRGVPTDALLTRAEFVVDVHELSRLVDARSFLAALEDGARANGAATGARTRDHHRGVTGRDWPPDVIAPLDPVGVVDLEAWGRRWWR